MPYSDKPKVLFVAPFPPPNRGVANVMQGFWDSPYLHSKYQMQRVNLTRRAPENIRGRFHWRNVFSTLGHWLAVVLASFGRPDIVNVVYTSYFAVVKACGIALIARLANARVVAHLHGSGFDNFYRGGSPFLRKLVRLSLRPAQLWVTTGDYWRALLVEMGVDPSVIMIIPNPQRAEVIQSRPKTDYSVQGVPQILFVGSVGYRKGVDLLAQALSIVQKHGYTFKVSIVGGEERPGERSALQELFTRSFDKSCYQFIDYVSGTDYFDLLRQSTLFVFPSRNENYPMALCEAMAMGLPVIATPVGAVTEFLKDQENGLIVPVENVDALASVTERLLSNEMLRRKLGQIASVTFRQSLAPELLARRLDEAFSTVLEKP